MTLRCADMIVTSWVRAYGNVSDLSPEWNVGAAVSRAALPIYPTLRPLKRALVDAVQSNGNVGFGSWLCENATALQIAEKSISFVAASALLQAQLYLSRRQINCERQLRA